MTFTKELPTVDGYYLWRADEGGAVRMTDVWKGQDGVMYAFASFAETVAELGGEWCRLVPAAEVRAIWDEAFRAGGYGYRTDGDVDDAFFSKSRAKRVMEGKE